MSQKIIAQPELRQVLRGERADERLPRRRRSARRDASDPRRAMTPAPAPMPPVDVELERDVLGGALHSADVARAVVAAPGECFYVEAHRIFYRALGRIALNGAPPAPALVAAAAAAQGEPLDPVLIAHALDAGLLVLDAAPYLAQLRELAAEREEAAAGALVSAHYAQGAAAGNAGGVFQEVRARLARADALRAVVDAPAEVWPLFDAADPWEFPPPAFIVPGLLPRHGVVSSGGKPKRHKSLLWWYLALSIAARRRRVFDSDRFPILDTPKILFVSREDSGARLGGRRADMLTTLGALAPGALTVLIRPRVDLLNAAHVTRLRALCLDKGITVVILDTLTSLSPSADPLGAKDQASLAATLVQLAQDIDGVVVVIDHSRKNRPDGQALSSADLYGPLQKWAAAEHLVMLEQTAEPGRLEVFVEGKDADSSRFFLTVAPRGSGLEKFTWAGTIAEIADAQRQVGADNRAAVLAAVAAAPEALGLAEIASRVTGAEGKPLSRDTIQRHLAALVEAEIVRKTGQGRATRYFALATNGTAPSSAHRGSEDE